VRYGIFYYFTGMISKNLLNGKKFIKPTASVLFGLNASSRKRSSDLKFTISACICSMETIERQQLSKSTLLPLLLQREMEAIKRHEINKMQN
jgi:hypothetical protein